MDKMCDLPAGWRYILVVRTPSTDPEQLAALRDHVLGSLASGVLVLPDEHPYCLDILPPLGDVQVMSPEYYAAVDELFQEPDPEPEPESPEVDVYLRGGKCAKEKRDIQARLRTYRESHGLGCWIAVAKASSGKLTDDQLRDMAAGTANLPIAEWRLAARALEKAGKLK